jgi:hypothetical protein
LLSTKNSLRDCHCGRINPTSYLDQTLKDDKDKNLNRSKNAKIRIAAVKDSIEAQQGKKKLNLERRNQSTVKQRKEAQKLKAELGY